MYQPSTKLSALPNKGCACVSVCRLDQKTVQQRMRMHVSLSFASELLDFSNIWWLVGGIPTPLKNMSSSVGIIIPNIWKIIKFMFQTTNQHNYGKSQFLMAKSTISMAIFHSYVSLPDGMNIYWLSQVALWAGDVRPHAKLPDPSCIFQVHLLRMDPRWNHVDMLQSSNLRSGQSKQILIYIS